MEHELPRLIGLISSKRRSQGGAAGVGVPGGLRGSDDDGGREGDVGGVAGLKQVTTSCLSGRAVGLEFSERGGVGGSYGLGGVTLGVKMFEGNVFSGVESGAQESIALPTFEESVAGRLGLDTSLPMSVRSSRYGWALLYFKINLES